MKKILDKIKNSFLKIDKKLVLRLAICAFIVDIVIETLARFQANGVITGGILGGLMAIIHRPYVILFGTLLIFFTLSFGLLFKRKYFAIIFISAIWIIFGLCDFVLLSYRVTPFSAVDFGMIDDALAILTKYASPGAVIGVIILTVVLIIAFIVIAKKAPVDKKRNIASAICVTIISFAITIGAGALGRGTGLLATEFPNLADAYIDNGFAYCFYNSIFNTGITKPKTYSKDKTNAIVKETTIPEASCEPSIEEVKNVRPDTITEKLDGYNVIFLQLESFFDITEVSHLQFSNDPIPYFRSLLASCPSGYLSMPCIGAGTANTEFEVITGMNLDFFGPGEYPYKTVLKNTSCESMAFNYHDQGYATHAIHNNRASFYNRHKIFANLGFDDFTSFELMNITEETPNGWAKDKILTNEIMTVLNSTENRDLVYTISVQGHGKYPSTSLIENPAIQLLDGASEDKWYGIEYYANQIKEMDDFLQELTTQLSTFNEPVILVSYGDHLPGLGFSDNDLPEGVDCQQTQYFIWSNQGTIALEDADIEAYELGSRVMEYLGYNNGVINNFHQTHHDMPESEYLEDLKILEYDMLYGEKYVYGGSSIYNKTDMKFGVNNVCIDSIEQDASDDTKIDISGKYFTEYSRIYVNGTYVDTTFIDPMHLEGSIADFESGETINIQVCQSYKGKLMLQYSNTFSMPCRITEKYQEDAEDYENNNDNYENPNDLGAMIEENQDNNQPKPNE